MKIDIGAQNILRSLERTEKKLFNAQAQISSGLQNPNPATNPLASTISRSLSQDISTAKQVQSVVSQAKGTVEIAWSTLRLNTDLLAKMKVQAIQASNGTYSGSDLVNTFDPPFQQNLGQFNSNMLSTWGSKTLFDGTFSMNVQTDIYTVKANLPGSAVQAELSAGDLTINGVDVGATIAGGVGVAIDIASAINVNTSSTGVIATAQTSISGSGVYSVAAFGSSAGITINGTPVNVGPFLGTETANQAVYMAVEAINTAFLGTPINALNDNGYLQINASDGRDLTISYGPGVQANIAGPTTGTFLGTITLSSVNSITIGGITPTNAGFTFAETATAMGITAVTFGDIRAATVFGSPLPDLTTQANAQAAITAIDTALTTLLNEMSRISIYSSQFNNVEDNVGVTALNLQDTLSTMQDADFAEVATNSERLKVLQEAAMATLRTEFKSSEKLAHLVGESLRGR